MGYSERMERFALITILLLAGSQLVAQAVRRPVTGADSCALLVTIALGDAVDEVRAARVFADDPRRRQELAELEILFIREIESEPDTNVRKAAWRVGYMMDRVRKAQDMRADMERTALEVTNDLDARDEALKQLFTREYRFHLRGVLNVLEPRQPWRCARRRWDVLYARTIRAEAL